MDCTTGVGGTRGVLRLYLDRAAYDKSRQLGKPDNLFQPSRYFNLRKVRLNEEGTCKRHEKQQEAIWPRKFACC